jgi:hypothetical protein
MQRGFPIDRSAGIGVAVIALIGLGAGIVMKPTLRELNGPQGPQILGPVAGPRAQFIDNRSAFDNYRYGVPDYVIGVDWLKSQEPQYVEVDPEPELRPYDVAAYGPPPSEFDSRQEEEEGPMDEDPSYPSMGGGILRVAEPPEPPLAPEPPEPPQAPLAIEAPIPPTPPPA